jgi:hypothetical protein
MTPAVGATLFAMAVAIAGTEATAIAVKAAPTNDRIDHET